MKCLLPLALLCMLFAACDQSTSDPWLTQKVSDLETRVALLEQQLSEKNALKAAAPASKSRTKTTAQPKNSANSYSTSASSTATTTAPAQPQTGSYRQSSYTSSYSSQCRATTKKGSRCKRTTRSAGYCWQHGG